MWRKLLLIFLNLSLCGCTISNTSVHTQGKADDVVDTEQTVTPKTDVTATIPLR